MVFVYATPLEVAIGWAASVPGLSAAMVGDRLPANNTTWSASGYLTAAVVGGQSRIEYRKGEPVVSFQAWARTPDSSDPPWRMAGNLLETLRSGTYPLGARAVPLSACSEDARVLACWFLGEPRRVYGDLGDYAAVTVDMQFHWVSCPR